VGSNFTWQALAGAGGGACPASYDHEILLLWHRLTTPGWTEVQFRARRVGRSLSKRRNTALKGRN
jgi:hypothetical protein